MNRYVHQEWPTPDRSDSQAVLINRWHAPSTERQRRFTQDMVNAVWQDHHLPPSMLSFNLYLSEDERTLMAYKQWTSKADYDDFLTDRGLEGARAFEAANPDVNFHADWFAHHQGVQRDNVTPGCVVLVDIKPDTVDSGKRWMNDVITAVASELPAPETISAHFHLGIDATKIVNYAEWEDAQSHRRSLDTGRLSSDTTSRWQKVQRFEGVTFTGFTRYRLLRSIARPLTAAE